MGGRIETVEVGWVRTEDCIPAAAVGERFVCLVPVWLRNAAKPSYSVEVLEATADGWENQNHFVIEDCIAWCSEHDFNAAAVEVFGELTWEADRDD